MNKSISLNISGEESLKKNLLEIEITPQNLKEWCLALFLIKESLLDEITLLGKQKIKLSLISDMRHESDRAFWENDSKRKKLMISRIEIDYWIKYFLGIYRDEFSNVNHLDIEATELPLKNNMLNVYLKYNFSENEK